MNVALHASNDEMIISIICTDPRFVDIARVYHPLVPLYSDKDNV